MGFFHQAVFAPRERVAPGSTAYVTGTDVFPADIIPRKLGTTLKVEFVVDAAVTPQITKGGVLATLNSGAPVVAGAEYAFTTIVREEDPVNFQFSGNCNILWFYVYELTEGEGL